MVTEDRKLCPKSKKKGKMSREEDRKHLLSDITVQVVRGGATQTIRGVLNRSAGCSRLRRGTNLRPHLAQAGRSLAAFVVGLLLASLYGAMALFLQNQPLWFCAYTSVVLGSLVAFGMGLSAGVRADVMVMLPTMCSARGRNFILLLFVSTLLSGPMKNTLENTQRAASSLLCGAELAANQTQELMQRAATPLFSVVDKIREISSNAYTVAGRVQNFINSLTDSVRHVARTLRNVLHFLVDIGDICNDKLGAPYRKCRDVFAEARTDCVSLLGEFSFLCDIMDGFLPLCNIARASELFCVIPSYIAYHLKQRLAEPTVAAFKKMMREFDFNITASVQFDVNANRSRSLQQVSQEIMAEISSDLQMFQKLGGPLMYGSLVLLGWAFLRAVQYRRRYLRELSFDNIYINAQFKELEQQVTSEGGASVLPLTRREAQTYITPLSFQLSYKERRAVLMGVASVFKHLVIGSLLVSLDFLVFWILDQVYHQVKGDVIARAPVSLVVRVNGSGYASDIFRDLVASFNILQRGNITVISRKCLMEPSEPNYITCFILGFLLGLALLVSLTGGFMQRCRRLICASYHPERELQRIRFLRQQILDQRRAVGRALRRSAARNQADRQEGGGGGGGRAGALLQTLLKWLPRAVLPRLQGLLSPLTLTCLACGETVRPKDEDTVTCDVPRCSGVFCRTCFHSLGNMCAVCMRPLTFQEDSEEELDSSDDEQLNLWSAALKSPHIVDRCSRGLMKRRIFTAKRRRPTARPEGGVCPTAQPQGGVCPTAQPQGGVCPTARPEGGVGPTARPEGGVGPTARPQGGVRPTARPQGGVRRSDGGDEGESDGSDHLSILSDSDLSEADMTYQDRPGSADSDASFHSAHSPERFRLQNQELTSVCIGRPLEPSRTRLQDPEVPFIKVIKE